MPYLKYKKTSSIEKTLDEFNNKEKKNIESSFQKIKEEIEKECFKPK